jgi:methylisocitrate lyase
LREALTAEKPLQIVGAINAYAALLAQQAGFKALYLSGSGVASNAFGLPDLGITNLIDVVSEVQRITSTVSLPLLVDVDTGWGNIFGIARTVREMTKAQAAAIHIEDQINSKRCGHRPGKELVDASEMCDRLKAATDARTDADFVIMARTDAAAVEGLAAAIERANRYVEAGADMIFAEALQSLDEYQQFVKAVKVPVLANLTEFGKTPLFTVTELQKVGVAMALYPLSAFRAMSKAAEIVYTTIRQQGTQREALPLMQTREELYQTLRYHEYEEKLDQFLQKYSGKAR